MDVVWYIVAMCMGFACCGITGSYFATHQPLDLIAALAAAFFGGVALTLGCMTTILQARSRIGKRGDA